jgi:hypothetical protein
MENTTTKETQNVVLTETNENTEKIIKTPVFIIFAEYLGYVSRFNELAIDWCDGKVPDEYIQNILIMEAKSIFRQMKQDYTIEEIQYWYNTYYPVILVEYDEKLNSISQS